MADTPSVVLPQYSQRAARPRSRLSYAMVTLGLIAIGAIYGLMMVFLPLWLIAIPLGPILILVVLALWLMPDVNKYDSDRITHAFWIFLGMLALWPQYIAIAIPGLPWINLQRIALAWLMLWFVGSIATASSLRHEVIATARYSKLFFWSFVTFAAVQWLTMVFSGSPFNSLQKAVIQTFMWTAMFFVACHIFLRPGTAMKTLRLMVYAVIVIGAIGVWEQVLQQVPWANSIPQFLHVEEDLLSYALSSQARNSDGYYRVRSVFSNTLLFAEFLAVMLPFVLHFIVTSRSMWFRFVSIVAYALLSVGIVNSHSRLGSVGWIEAHFLYLGIWAVRRLVTRRSDLFAATLAYGFPALIMGAFGLMLASHRFYALVFGNGATQASTEARFTQRDMAIPKLLGNPLGHGAGQSGQVLGYTDPSGILTVDSYLITLLLDYGIIGFFAYFTMLFSAAFTALRYYFLVGDDDELQLLGPIAVALCNWAVVRLVVSLDSNQPLLFALLGMVAALATRAALVVKTTTAVPVMVAPGWKTARA
jgi:hypothetical protein